MQNREIVLTNIDKYEAARYLGYKDSLPDVNMTKIILECEQELLKIINPRFCYKIFDIVENGNNKVKLGNSELILNGESISEHLEDCQKVIVLCTTLSESVDKLINKCEVSGEMVKVLIYDALANAAIEQVCDESEKYILQDFNNYNHTFRFGVGYGDFPLSTQKLLLETLDASKRIGVCATESYILTPRKSVTCVIGLSDFVQNKSKSCKNCSMINGCRYRENGSTCYKN